MSVCPRCPPAALPCVLPLPVVSCNTGSLLDLPGDTSVVFVSAARRVWCCHHSLFDGRDGRVQRLRER